MTDHQYFHIRSEAGRADRCPSIFGSDHEYMKQVTPKKSGKRSRDDSTPTGKTPSQQAKIHAVKVSHSGHTKKAVWSSEEKDFITTYISSTPRSATVTLSTYWDKCATVFNIKFPASMRNGHACKSLAQRLLLAPEIVMESTERTFCSTSTQTDLTLPVNSSGFTMPEHSEGEWIFVTPRKELQESASKGATLLNESALKRLRQFADLERAERNYLINLLLSTTNLRHLAQSILGTSLGDQLKCLMLYDIESEARDCASRRSVLHQKAFKDLADFKWDSVITEIAKQQPLLLEVLLSVALPTGKIGNTKSTEALPPIIGCLYGMLMNQRFHELSRVQRVVSITLANEQTHQKVYDRLQPLGITVSHSIMLDTMTAISGTFNSELIDHVKSGRRFRIVGDNINFRVGVTHERQNKSSHMEHWFGSAAIIQNVRFDGRSDIVPQCDLRQLPVECFVMNNNDWCVVKHDMSVLILRVLIDFFPWLAFAKSIVKEELSTDMPCEIRSKNKVIPLQVMRKNEQKYAEVIDILDSYQNLCESVYQSCDLPVPKVQIGGDQLTRDRFYGAKRLRAAAFTNSERLENLTPITFELFHLQMTLLTTFYNILYNKESHESFTLHAQKIRLQRKDADGEDVKNHYDSCKELAESFIRAYIVEAACNILGLASIDEKPDNLPDSQTMGEEEIKHWSFDLANKIVSTAVKDSYNHIRNEEVENNSDCVSIYGKTVLELGLIFLDLNDIIKSPSRVRMMCLFKYIMLVLKGHNTRSKYALEILRLLCQQLALLSEKNACDSFYGLFVNTGRTIIPADLQMEYLVRLTKGHLKSMCSNITESSMVKRSSAFFGMEEIASNFDTETHVIHRAQRHKRPSSHEDELRIVRDLKQVKPFLHVSNRQIPSVNKVPRNPITKLDIEKLFSWISYHKMLCYYEF